MSHSCLYTGTVAHVRHQPKAHRLQYRVFALWLDLDELDSLDKRLRLFSHNRPALFSLHDKDHGERSGCLKAHVSKLLMQHGIGDPGGPVRLMCYPRVMGYVFNPLSVYYCYDRDEQLKAVIYEVNNTHGERHAYVIPVTDHHGRRIRQSCDKVFFVSPFMPPDCRYRFHLNRPDEQLQLFIHETHRDRPILDAWFNGRRQEINDAALLKAAISIPWLSLKVILGIHWEALKLLLKGLPIYRHPDTPSYSVSYIDEPRQEIPNNG